MTFVLFIRSKVKKKRMKISKTRDNEYRKDNNDRMIHRKKINSA